MERSGRMFKRWMTTDGWRAMLASASRPEFEQAILRVLSGKKSS